MTDFLKDLNDAQRAAVEATEGPVMVIAGAGSGKTRVLTYRVAYLVSQGVDPFNILALTFTNKAAREMKDRITSLVGGNEARNVWMGTFHSIFARVLRVEGQRLGYPPNYTIYDTDDSKRVIKAIIKESNLDDKVYQPGYVLHRISAAKTSLISAQEYNTNPDITEYDSAAGKPLTGQLYTQYQSRLFRASAMDFDDLLFNMNILLRDFPEVLYKYQKKFVYLLVDEYQDTNYAQYLILNKLAANNENICVVGDDAQSIYAFRGANIQNILNFRKDYPDHKVFKLEQNYRSTKTIVAAANQVIVNNKQQIFKEIWTDNEEGSKITLIRASTDGEEGNLVAQSIFENKMNNQLQNNAFAILYRTNAQSRSFEESLRKLNIPCRIYGGISFYQRKEIKDLLAYFRLVINHKDEDALLRVINYPARGIGKTTLEKLVAEADRYKKTIFEILDEPDTYPVQL
ncbi:MAG TPA: UvrD-helicase domain-containing protein, partial [Bacteroidales bacterium]|nr:UvrD-helicase domain-containing protein [Bacteroidales bacterium]